MTLTVNACDAFLTANLGGTPASRSVLDCVNDTGKWLTISHSWNWMRSRSTTITATASQNYLDLPSGVRSIDSIYTDNSLTYHMQQRTLEEILDLRTSAIGGQTDQFQWAANYRTVAATATVPQYLQPIIELWPTPSATTTATFLMFHTAGWADLTDDADGVLVPDWLIPLFLEALSLVAKGYDEHDTADVTTRLQLLTGSDAWTNALRYDGGLQPVLGREERGAAMGTPWWATSRYYKPTMGNP